MSQSKNPPCAQQVYHVTRADLPLSCPMPSMRITDAHPRVFLPIEDKADGEYTCPYCAAHYVLKKDS